MRAIDSISALGRSLCVGFLIVTVNAAIAFADSQANTATSTLIAASTIVAVGLITFGGLMLGSN